MISKAERGWLAAIVEGEGHITIGKLIRSDNGKFRYNFQVGVDNTNPLIPLKIHSLIGGNCFEIKACGLGKKRVYRWSITGTKRVIPFIKLIRPFMVTKTEQADIILNNISIFQKSKLPRNSDKFTLRRKEIVEAKEVAYKAMRTANYKTILSEAFPFKDWNVQRLNGNPSQEVKIKSELIGNYERKSEEISRLN